MTPSGAWHGLRSAGVAVLLSLAVSAMAAGGSAGFHARAVPPTPVSGQALSDQDGAKRALADFAGRVVLLFFGFTHCPDVCPTEMARMVELVRVLGPETAKRVQVVFVTLDPARDTPELLREYLQAFSRDFVALRGTEEETAAMAAAFRVFYRKVEGSAPGRYTLEHSAYVHVIDPQGRLRLRVTPDLGVNQIAEDVRRLLEGG